jgi:glyoxylase-like metal-dependent hydrolase (beta-lactamase superfamily II)
MTRRNTTARRTFLLGGLSAGLVLAGAPATATAISGVATMPAGPFRITALLDASGPFFLPAGQAFSGATERDWARARELDPGAFGPDDTWQLDFRCFAIHLPAGGVALVDAGVGPVGSPASSWAPVPGHLFERLAAAGIDPAEVRMVVLTHLHEDHFGWTVSPEGVPHFSNARYVVQRSEVDALERESNQVVLSYVVEPLRRAGQLDTVDGEVCLARAVGGAVTTLPTPGHTPGHQSVRVRGPWRQVVITGDVLVHAVQLVDPEVGYRFESDQDLARRSRVTLLEDAERRPTVLATAHLTTPFVPVRS